jgi:hypothetical protein
MWLPVDTTGVATEAWLREAFTTAAITGRRLRSHVVVRQDTATTIMDTVTITGITMVRTSTTTEMPTAIENVHGNGTSGNRNVNTNPNFHGNRNASC